MPGPVLDVALVPRQHAQPGWSARAVATFARRPTSRAPRAQAIVCAGVDPEAGGASPYAMAYDAASRNVLWSAPLDAPPDAIAAAFDGAARCAIVRARRAPMPPPALAPPVRLGV